MSQPETSICLDGLVARRRPRPLRPLVVTAEDSMATNPPNQIHSQLLQDDPDLREIVEEFVRGLPGRMEEIREAFEKLDWQQLSMLAHRLKGASGSYGYPDLSALAATMERGFRAQQAEELGQWMDRFSKLVDAAKAGLSD
jgi:HPt (histidine-containing phosphotransfer) domain-containing protein